MNVRNVCYLYSGRIFLLDCNGYLIECTEMRDVAVDGKQHLEVRESNDPHVVWRHLVDYKDKWLLTVSTQRGCTHSCRFCLPPDAKILMNDYTYKNIIDVKLGDLVIANYNTKENQETGKQYATLTTKIANVTGIIKRQYEGDMYNILTESGKKINCTSEHPIAKKYKTRILFDEAKNLKVGDYIISGKGMNLNNYNNDVWKIGWMNGFLHGDGIYDEIDGRRWQISQKYKYVLQHMIDLLDYFNIKHTEIWEQGSEEKENLCYRFAIQGKNILSLEKIINKFENTNDYMIGYLSGFWDAEGFSFLHNSSIKVCSSSLEEINYVENILKMLGYNYSIYKAKKEKMNHKIHYIINIHLNRDEFISKFTPIHHKKIYLDNINSKKFSYFDKIVEINIEKYNGVVYNIETSEHSYYANDILNHNCDVAKLPFKGNLTQEEIENQVKFILHNTDYVKESNKVKIGFARMGEPSHNLENVLNTIKRLPEISAEQDKNFRWLPCFNTILPAQCKHNPYEVLDRVLETKENDYNGFLHLQISCNSTDEETRSRLFGGAKVFDLESIVKYINQKNITNRTVTLNFIVMKDIEVNVNKLKSMGLTGDKFAVKLIPLNKTNNADKNNLKTYANYSNYEKLIQLKNEFNQAGVPTVVDAIAKCEEAGLCCGQLAQIYQ